MLTIIEQSLQRVLSPHWDGAALRCPRCAALLSSNGSHFACHSCGYEYGVAQFLAARALSRRRLGTGALARSFRAATALGRARPVTA